MNRDETISALASYLPAGTHTAQKPEWGTRDVATFLTDHLLAAGYKLVYEEDPAISQLIRDQEVGEERR